MNTQSLVIKGTATVRWPETPVRPIEETMKSIPPGNHAGWDRYDTDNQMALTLWDAAGNTYDIRIPKAEGG